MATYKITLSASNWTQTTTALWWDSVSQTVYGDSGLTVRIDHITPPTRECWAFAGYLSGSVKCIDEYGNYTSEFLAKLAATSEAFTLTVSGAVCSYKLTLDDNGGSSGNQTAYCKKDEGGWYADDQCTEPVSGVDRPTYSGKAFTGYFNGSSTAGTQYVNADGSFTADMEALVLTAAKTVYAWWQAPFAVTVSKNGGTGGTSTFYYDGVNGLFFADSAMTTAIEKIEMPTRECYEPLLYTTASPGDEDGPVVWTDGTIDEYFTPTGATTLQTVWTWRTYRVGISNAGGTGGVGTLYYSTGVSSVPGFCYDDLGEDYVDYWDEESGERVKRQVSLPTRANYAIRGVYSAKTGGTQLIDRNGWITDDSEAWGEALTTATTVYAQWAQAFKATIDANGGTGGTAAAWYSPDEAAWYGDSGLTEAISGVTAPTRECWRLGGVYTAKTGGTLVIAADGAFASGAAISAAQTLYAQWSRVSYKLALDAAGGSGGTAALYNGGTDATYYADDGLTTAAAGVTAPTRAGYAFNGYYSATSGGSKYIDETGAVVATVGIAADTTLYARWTANTYTLTFDYDGGTGATATKSVTYGQAIGALPTGTRTDATFGGWKVNGATVTATTLYTVAGNVTAKAVWQLYFGNLTDWFNASGALLEIVASASGTRAGVTNLHNGATDAGTAHPNPVCTYRVKAEGTVALTLGRAYGDYFLTEAEYATGADREPTLTLRGVANEGQDAVTTYAVALGVSPDHVAQDPFAAVSGGGELVECTSAATCEPTVCYEGNEPCASDVSHGLKRVTATTCAYFGEGAPTAAAGWLSPGAPNAENDVDYASYAFTAERDL